MITYPNQTYGSILFGFGNDIDIDFTNKLLNELKGYDKHTDFQVLSSPNFKNENGSTLEVYFQVQVLITPTDKVLRIQLNDTGAFKYSPGEVFETKESKDGLRKICDYRGEYFDSKNLEGLDFQNDAFFNCYIDLKF